METAIGKVVEYTVVPLTSQLKYAFRYKSFVSDMKNADHELENDEKIIKKSVDEAVNNLKEITDKTKEWLQEVDEAHKEVTNLFNYEQGEAMKCSCIGHILNPIARHQLGRKAIKKKLAIEELLVKKPKPEEICYAPQASGIVNKETAAAAAAAARRTDNGVIESSCWNEAISKIMKKLKDDTTNIVGLYGMGGVGKSTMINEVHLRVLEQCMFDEVAKVEVKAEVDIMRIQEEIASALGLTFTNRLEAVRARELSKRLLKTDQKNETDDEKKNKKKSVLIILDDLWEKLEFGRVGIPPSNNQVQIKFLLTSRDEHLLSDKMGARDPIPLDVLNDADALRMFKRVVGLEDEDKSEKASKAAEIAPKCSGLPVVIMAIANALKNKVLKEWKDVLQQLDVTDALSKLEVSYDHLPSEESKRLFLICGIIRGSRIQVRDLLKYTFGLGLYERKDIYTLIAAATELDNLLSSLKAASMLLKSDDLGYVKIHDRMRDLALRIVDRDRSEWVHFTLRADRCKIPRRFDASKVELLLSYCEEDDSQLLVPHSFFKDMKKLYVLEFKNLNGGFSLPSPTDQLNNLANLETLCLHNCSLSDISMIGELKGLRILSFQGSDLRKIPIQLQGLTALKMLDLSDCKELTQIEPDVLGSLTKLEELNMENSFKDWEIDQEDDARPPSNARLVELRNMSRLSNVKIHIPSTSMLPKDDQLFSSKLTIYKIMLGGVWTWGIKDAYRKESKVLMLQFDDSRNVLQLDWVQATLRRTEALYLRGRLDGKCESIDELCIKGFECLKHLKVSLCPSIRYIVSSNSGSSFMDLESLSLNDLENLEKLCNGETFSKLKVTKVKDCNKLTHLFNFSVLKCNSELEEIIIHRCNEMHCIAMDEDDKNYDVVKLLKLQRLELRWLPKFQAFCVPQGPQPPMKALFSGRKVAFPCLESLQIWRLDELEYIWHLTDPPTELGKLRSLYVRGCDKLVRVINSSVLIKLLQHLESLTIYNCESIEHVFDVKTHSDAISYSYLKELVISSCPQLRTFGHYLPSEQDSVADNLFFFSQKEIFPCLESIDFSGLENVGEIWPDEVPPQTSFNMLKTVTFSHCSATSVLFPSTIIARLDNLTDISVGYCVEMTQIFNVKEKKSMHDGGGSNSESEKRDKEATNKEMTFTFFPCLTKLVLINLPKLVTVYSLVQTHNDAVSFSSLKEMTISSCPQLRTFGQYLSPGQDYVTDDLSFFSQKVAFPCLESLVIIGLDELEDIWHPTHPPTEFGKLRSLDVGYCDKLVRVINSNVLMKLLQHLESLTVVNCASIEYVFDVKEIVPCLETDHLHHLKENNGGEGEEEEEEGRRRGDIHREMLTFNHLKELTLWDLDNLESFSSSSSVDLNFPSLEELIIDGCPKMRIFSNGGILTTPKLHKISWSTWNARDRNQLMTEDLNTTIQKKYAPVAEQMSNDESDSE